MPLDVGGPAADATEPVLVPGQRLAVVIAAQPPERVQIIIERLVV